MVGAACTADDIDGMVEVKSKSSTPMMIDEGLRGVRDMREIIAKRAADKVNIKLMKCGGIYPATKLAHMAEMAGIECQIGSMVESSIGSAAGFHVAIFEKDYYKCGINRTFKVQQRRWEFTL